jgi:hypothetical protein
MGFLNAIFGGSGSGSSTTSTSLPDWFNAYGQDLFNAGRTRFLNAPYAGPYTGTRVAADNSDIEASRTGVREMQGDFQPAIDQAQGMTSSAGQLFNQGDFNQFMSPYTEGVVNRISDLGARNLGEKLLPQLNANFISSGNWGSSQNTDFTQRAVRDTQEAILGEQAKALESGFGQSLGAYQAGQQRQLAAGAQTGALAQLQQSMGLRDAAALEEVGKDERNQAQKRADVGYGDYLEGRDWERNMLQGAANIGQGYTPPATTTTNTTQDSGGSLGGLGQLLGGAAAVGSLFVGHRRGGRIRGALRRARGGRIRRFALGGGAPRDPTVYQPFFSSSSGSPGASYSNVYQPFAGVGATGFDPTFDRGRVTDDNPATTQPLGQMARETWGLARDIVPGNMNPANMGWGELAGSLIGLGFGPGLGTLGALGDRARGISVGAMNQDPISGRIGSGVPSQQTAGALAQAAAMDRYGMADKLAPGSWFGMFDTQAAPTGDISGKPGDMYGGGDYGGSMDKGGYDSSHDTPSSTSSADPDATKRRGGAIKRHRRAR